jgi:hypothetical protein
MVLVAINPATKYPLTLYPIVLDLEIWLFSKFPRPPALGAEKPINIDDNDDNRINDIENETSPLLPTGIPSRTWKQRFINQLKYNLTLRRIMFRTFVSSLVLLVAVFFPNFNSVVSLLGSVFAVTSSILFPMLCFLSLFKSPSGLRQMAMRIQPTTASKTTSVVINQTPSSSTSTFASSSKSVVKEATISVPVPIQTRSSIRDAIRLSASYEAATLSRSMMHARDDFPQQSSADWIPSSDSHSAFNERGGENYSPFNGNGGESSSTGIYAGLSPLQQIQYQQQRQCESQIQTEADMSTTQPLNGHSPTSTSFAVNTMFGAQIEKDRVVKQYWTTKEVYRWMAKGVLVVFSGVGILGTLWTVIPDVASIGS